VIGAANLVRGPAGGTPYPSTSVLYGVRHSRVPNSVCRRKSNLTRIRRGDARIHRTGLRPVGAVVAADGTKYLFRGPDCRIAEAIARPSARRGAAVTIAGPAFGPRANPRRCAPSFSPQPNLAPGGVPPTF